MATGIQRVAIFGASGNFGTPITAALQRAGFDLTIITRTESKATFPSGIRVIRATYTVEELSKALTGQDAVICVVGPAGIKSQIAMIDGAEAAGVKRFIIDDFGWGPGIHGLPEFEGIQSQRRRAWEHAKARSEANPKFTYSGIATGNPIDWALKLFPRMGFDIKQCSAIIYDAGTERFTGTTLEGIGQAVVGVLQHPEETQNRVVKALSIITCQNELLEAFQKATAKEWDITRYSTKALLESGRSKLKAGDRGWILDLIIAQLFGEGSSRCVVVPSREESDAELLGIVEESPHSVVAKVLR